MRSRFDEQLADLNKKLIEMGAMCEECISLAAKALKEGNPGIRWEVEPLDNSLDDLERNVESLCLKLLLQQQPVARDLRQVSTALKMITDIKRIGDQASEVAEIIGFLNGRTSEECEYLDQMATATIKMVTESIDSFVKSDLNLANSIIEYDDVVDEYFNKVKIFLIDLIAKNPKDGEYALDLLMIAKYFERIGDHAVNVAKWVVFSVTGNH